jgi:hypothetical protein
LETKCSPNQGVFVFWRPFLIQNGRSLRTADPFETCHKNRSSLKVVLFVFKIFKMAANLKIKLSKISKEILKF